MRREKSLLHGRDCPARQTLPRPPPEVVLLLREANTLVDTSAFMVQVFSGTDFPVTVLPKWLLPISLLLPLTYGLDATRGFLLKTDTLFSLEVEVALLIVSMFVMVCGRWFAGYDVSPLRRA